MTPTECWLSALLFLVAVIVAANQYQLSILGRMVRSIRLSTDHDRKYLLLVSRITSNHTDTIDHIASLDFARSVVLSVEAERIVVGGILDARRRGDLDLANRLSAYLHFMHCGHNAEYIRDMFKGFP